VTSEVPSSEPGGFTNQNVFIRQRCQQSSFGYHPIFQETPQIDEQTSGQGHDTDTPHSGTPAGEPVTGRAHLDLWVEMAKLKVFQVGGGCDTKLQSNK
jgi:hypothetical protein